MKKIIGIVLKTLGIILAVSWMVLILVESHRYNNDEPMLVVLKSETLNYDDGHVYVYYGLGYKEIIYEREIVYGKEFGSLFTKVRDTK